MTASSEPCTSALRTRLSVAISPRWIWRRCPRAGTAGEAHRVLAALAARRRCSRASATVRAVFSSGATRSSSPASGTSDEAEHLHRRRRAGLLDLLPVVVDQRPDRAPGRHRRRSGRRPSACRPVDEHGGDRAAARRRGWPRARRPWPGPSGLAVSSSSSATTSSCSSRSSMPRSCERRHLDDDRVAAPRLGHEPVLGELLAARAAGRRCRGRSC